MSSFVVRDRTVNQIVTWLREQNRDSIYHRKLRELFSLDPLDNEGFDTVAKDMFELNCRVVRQRHSDTDECLIPEKSTPRREFASTIQVYKSLKCWLYQCSGGDICETSILFSIMREIADCLAHEIICGLDAYKDAAWDWRGEGGHKLIH